MSKKKKRNTSIFYTLIEIIRSDFELFLYKIKIHRKFLEIISNKKCEFLILIRSLFNYKNVILLLLYNI